MNITSWGRIEFLRLFYLKYSFSFPQVFPQTTTNSWGFLGCWLFWGVCLFVFWFFFRDKINTLIKHFNDWRYWKEENKCTLFQGVLMKRTTGPLSMKLVSSDTEFHSRIYRKLCNSHLLKYLFIQIHQDLENLPLASIFCFNTYSSLQSKLHGLLLTWNCFSLRFKSFILILSFLNR